MYSSSPVRSAPVCSDKASITTSAIQKASHPNWLVAAGNFFFHLRNGLFPAVFLLIALVLRPAELLGDARLDRIGMVLGALVILAGQFIRFFVIGYAYIRRGGKNRKIHADRLVVKGLYAHARNPMYFGNILIAAGFSIYFGSLLMTAVTMAFFGFVYLAITAAEERYLLLKFGPEYEEYIQRVNRFVPNLQGLSQSLAGHPFQWREALSKEYGTISATAAGLLVVTMWKIICVSGWEGARARVEDLAWAVVPLAAFYVTLRFLKVTGRLTASKVPKAGRGGV